MFLFCFSPFPRISFIAFAFVTGECPYAQLHSLSSSLTVGAGLVGLLILARLPPTSGVSRPTASGIAGRPPWGTWRFGLVFGARPAHPHGIDSSQLGDRDWLLSLRQHLCHFYRSYREMISLSKDSDDPRVVLVIEALFLTKETRFCFVLCLMSKLFLGGKFWPACPHSEALGCLFPPTGQ